MDERGQGRNYVILSYCILSTMSPPPRLPPTPIPTHTFSHPCLFLPDLDIFPLPRLDYKLSIKFDVIHGISRFTVLFFTNITVRVHVPFFFSLLFGIMKR